MKERIEHCLAEPDKAGRVGRAVDGFTLQPLAQSGIQTENTAALIDEAERCLRQFSPQTAQVHYRSHLAVCRLGRQKRRTDGADDERGPAEAARQMARILCAYGEDITLRVVSRSDGAQRLQTQFVISSESGGTEPIVSMLRSAYGTAEVRRVEDAPEFSIRMYAAGEAVRGEKKEEKKREEAQTQACRSWVTAVLSSLPENGNYSVRLRLSPVQQDEALRAQQTRLNEYYRKLRFYAELNWGNTVNLGSSVNKGQNMIASGLGFDTDGYNAGYGLSLSARDEDRRAALLAEQIEQEMKRLNRALCGGAWAVRVSVSAEDMDTIQTVSSVLSAAVRAAGFRLRWSTKPDTAPIFAVDEEVLPLMLFPTREFGGFAFVENETFSLLPQRGGEDGFPIGSLLWNGAAFAPFRLPARALSRHAFICGMTGAGKTNTLFQILEGAQLPLCVIEPVKGEYRALKSVYPDLRIWTMKVTDRADPAVRRMRINPFWFPRQGNLAFHIDSLKTIIASSFELTAAMPNILEQCLYNIYVKAGWDLVTNRNIYQNNLPEQYLYPTFGDLCSEIEAYLDASDFSGDTMGDYKGALLSRMKSFVGGCKGILLNTSEHPDYAQLMHGHCVIELEGLADDADKCLVMGTILVQYYAYLKLHFKASDGAQKLQHLFVIEEAHRLFKNTDTGKRPDGGPNPTGQLVDSLSNMMAEIRAFGEGMLIVDQSPTKIAEDVIKNSATKIVHRIDNARDIKALQSAMLLPGDSLSFAALAQGEALIRTDGMQRPCKVKVLRSGVKEAYSLAASFRAGDVSADPLADVFIATSVVGDETTCALVQQRLGCWLDCLGVFGMEHWYALTGDFLCQMLDILRARKQMDAVDYKMNVLFEIVSLCLKRLFAGQSKRELGAAHMFVMRLLDFFRDRRDGRFIKPGAVTLFERYLHAHVRGVLQSMHAVRVPAREHALLCRASGLEPDSLFAAMVTDYAHAALLARCDDRAPVDAAELLSGFLTQCVCPSARQQAAEQYAEAFERLAACMQELIDT